VSCGLGENGETFHYVSFDAVRTAAIDTLKQRLMDVLEEVCGRGWWRKRSSWRSRRGMGQEEELKPSKTRHASVPGAGAPCLVDQKQVPGAGAPRLVDDAGVPCLAVTLPLLYFCQVCDKGIDMTRMATVGR
jgi:hypothetical protein